MSRIRDQVANEEPRVPTQDGPQLGRRRMIIIAALVLVVAPAIRNHDSFPLSTYPVYSSVRPREQTFSTAIGELHDGTERRLSMAVIASTDDPLIAHDRVRTAIDGGRASELCGEIARRAPREVTTVLVVRESHDVVEAASGRDSLRSRTVHATCGTGR